MNTGLSVGRFTLADLIIADNIVVVARTEEDLKGVLNMHHVEYEKIQDGIICGQVMRGLSPHI